MGLKPAKERKWEVMRCDLCDVSTNFPGPFVPAAFCRSMFYALHSLSHPSIQATQRLIPPGTFGHASMLTSIGGHMLLPAIPTIQDPAAYSHYTCDFPNALSVL